MSARELHGGTADDRGEIDRGDVDLSGLFAAFGRRKRLILGSTLGAAAAALVFCMLVKPRYMAEARILVENQETYFTRADPDSARGADAPQAMDTEAVNSQIQLLTSRDLARKAVQILELKGNPEFDPAASSGGLLAPLAALGLLGDPARKTAEDRLLANFAEHLTVMSPTKTRVLQVEFSSRDPDLAARGANTVADLYMELQAEAKRDHARQAARSLKPLIAALEARVSEADARVEAFRAEKSLYEGRDAKTVPAQQLGEIAARLADARAAQSEAEARARGLRDLLKQGRLADAAEIANDDLVRRIAGQRVLVKSQLAADSRTMLERHPRIRELEAQLADIDAQLRAAVEKAARGQENDARVMGVRVAKLGELLEEQKRAVAVSGADETKLRELQLTAKTLKDQLASEAAKYQAAMARDEAETAPSDARIISRALAPSTPVFPKKLPIVIFAALAGLIFSAGAVALREMTLAPTGNVPPPPVKLDGDPPAPGGPSGTRLHGVRQALADFAAPASVSREASPTPAPAEARLAEPELSFAADDEPAPASRSPGSRDLVARIARAAKRGGSHVLIASAADAAPACASLTLARSLSREGRAILVQIDDSDPFLNEALEVASGGACDGAHPGLAQLLSGEAAFADAIFRDADSRLHIVQAGGAVDPQSVDLSLILDALQATYDFVLVAAGADKARELAAESDLTLILAADPGAREHLQDDIEASGARDIVLAGLDGAGDIVEIAA